jgi:hypothetical protein
VYTRTGKQLAEAKAEKKKRASNLDRKPHL